MAVQQADQNDTTSAQPAAHTGTERRIPVLFAIAFVAILFVSMVILLYLRQKPSPSGLLVLKVPARYDGAIATIDVADGRDLTPIKTTLTGDTVSRIFLPPGEYLTKVE